MALSKQQNRRQQNLPTINERIRFPEIRVIDSEGEQLGIMEPSEALRLAQERDLDLVLLSDKAEPPVCRIINYGKYKFEQEKKAREARKKQHTSDVKEVKMRYKIGDHDYHVRVNQAPSHSIYQSWRQGQSHSDVSRTRNPALRFGRDVAQATCWRSERHRRSSAAS